MFVLLCIVVFIFCGMVVAANAHREPVIDFSNSEINIFEYDIIERWVKEYPVMVPKIKESFADGKITKKELIELYDLEDSLSKEKYDLEIKEEKQKLKDALKHE